MRPGVRLALVATLLMYATQAAAGWLVLCADQDTARSGAPPQVVLAHYLQPNEQFTVLRWSPRRVADACAQVEVDIGADQIGWVGFAPELRADTVTLQLQGVQRDGRFKVHEVIVAGAEGVPEPLPQGPPLAQTTPMPGKPAAPRAAWFWSPAAWAQNPDKLLSEARQRRLGKIYISVNIRGNGIEHAARLRTFLRRAHEQNLQVWVTLGDPHAVLDQGQRHFGQLASVLAAFNKQGNADNAIDGVQLDIEPYLLAGFWKAPGVWLSRYAQTVALVRKSASQMALDVVLPYWMSPDKPDIARTLTAVAPHIARLTVMNYRTDPHQIRQFALPFLAWGAEHGKAVTIALESAPMALEERRHFRRAASGELLRLEVGTDTVALLLTQAPPNPPPQATAYRLTHQREIDGSDISFYKRRQDLLSLLDTLESEWSGWSSFGGMAIHGLDTWGAEAPAAAR